MTYSSFPTIDYVMLTYIFDLSMWCLHIFLLALCDGFGDLKNVYLTFL